MGTTSDSELIQKRRGKTGTWYESTMAEFTNDVHRKVGLHHIDFMVKELRRGRVVQGKSYSYRLALK